MKSRLKNWESDREVTDNKMFLKEIASGILNKWLFYLIIF